MRTRLLAATAVVAAAALALPASGAPAPQVVDPKGDAKTQSAGADIVSALFGTAGTTQKIGKRTVYTPGKLTVTVTYAAAPSTDPYVSHQVSFTAPGCGNVYLEIFSTGTFGVADCSPPDTSFDVSYKIAGNTITYTLPFSTLGKQYFKTGTPLTDLVTYTAFSDPQFGYESQEIAATTHVAGVTAAEGAIDFATSAASYRIG